MCFCWFKINCFFCVSSQICIVASASIPIVGCVNLDVKRVRREEVEDFYVSDAYLFFCSQVVVNPHDYHKNH